MSFNKVTVVGNLGQDPELRYTPQGIAVCNFSLAVNQKKKDKAGNWNDTVLWFRIVLWRNQAENASKYLVKGSPIYIEGRLEVEDWMDRNNQPKYTLVVQATDMQFIGSGQKNENNSGQDQSTPEFAGPPPDSAMGEPPAQNNQPAAAKVDDDIPF